MLSRPFKIENLEINVSNVYLEKIAAMAGVGRAIGGGVVKGVKAIGRVAGKGASALGTQVHRSIGGAYIDHAKSLGVRDPYKLADAVDIDKLKRMHSVSKIGEKTYKSNTAAAYAAHDDFDKNVFPHLKRQTRNARITVGAVAGGAAYGVHKVKEKMDEPKVQSYNYY